MSTVPATGRLGAGSRVRAVLGDRVLLGVTALAALITIALMVLIFVPFYTISLIISDPTALIVQIFSFFPSAR